VGKSRHTVEFNPVRGYIQISLLVWHFIGLLASGSITYVFVRVAAPYLIPNQLKVRDISDSHNDDYEDSSLLQCDAVEPGRMLTKISKEPAYSSLNKDAANSCETLAAFSHKYTKL
jgi:hypothetical protein